MDAAGLNAPESGDGPVTINANFNELENEIMLEIIDTGCGGSNEATSVDSGELQSYVEENAAALAEEDRLMEAEEEDEDDD